MYRRQVLAAGALTLALPVTGCLGGGDDDEPQTTGDDDSPIDADPETLLLTADQVETVDDREWSSEGPLGEGRDNRPFMHRGATVTRQIDPDRLDDEIVTPMVLSGVWYHDSVDAARTAYEEHPSYSSYAEEEGDVQVSIAVESMARIVDEPATSDFNGTWLFALFRDANVVGAVSYREEFGPDEEVLAETGVELTIAMHEAWRE